MYKVKVIVNYKDGNFDEVSTSFNIKNFADDWIAKQIGILTSYKPYKSYASSCEVV